MEEINYERMDEMKEVDLQVNAAIIHFVIKD